MFHQSFGSAPADEELRLRTPARDKARQLFVTHETLGECLELSRADTLDIYANCFMVERQTQTVSRMRYIEWLRITFRFAVF